MHCLHSFFMNGYKCSCTTNPETSSLLTALLSVTLRIPQIYHMSNLRNMMNTLLQRVLLWWINPFLDAIEYYGSLSLTHSFPLDAFQKSNHKTLPAPCVLTSKVFPCSMLSTSIHSRKLHCLRYLSSPSAYYLVQSVFLRNVADIPNICFCCRCSSTPPKIFL